MTLFVFEMGIYCSNMPQIKVKFLPATKEIVSEQVQILSF